MSSIDVQRRSEGWPAWLLVGITALVFVAIPVWVRSGTPRIRLPSTPANPVATLQGGQRIAFAPGDLVTGDGLLCQSYGLQVGAWVPRPGNATHASVTGTNWTATISIRTRDDGVVVARCT